MRRLGLMFSLIAGFMSSGFADSIIVSAENSYVGISLPKMLDPNTSCETSLPTDDVPFIYFDKGTSGAAHFDIPPFDKIIQNRNCDTDTGSRYIAHFEIRSKRLDGDIYDKIADLDLTYDITSCSGKQGTACETTYTCVLSPVGGSGLSVLVNTNDPNYPPEGNACQADIPIAPEYKADPDPDLDRLMFFPYSMAISVSG